MLTMACAGSQSSACRAGASSVSGRTLKTRPIPNNCSRPSSSFMPTMASCHEGRAARRGHCQRVALTSGGYHSEAMFGCRPLAAIYAYEVCSPQGACYAGGKMRRPQMHALFTRLEALWESQSA